MARTTSQPLNPTARPPRPPPLWPCPLCKTGHASTNHQADSQPSYKRPPNRPPRMAVPRSMNTLAASPRPAAAPAAVAVRRCGLAPAALIAAALALAPAGCERATPPASAAGGPLARAHSGAGGGSGGSGGEGGVAEAEPTGVEVGQAPGDGGTKAVSARKPSIAERLQQRAQKFVDGFESELLGSPTTPEAQRAAQAIAPPTGLFVLDPAALSTGQVRWLPLPGTHAAPEAAPPSPPPPPPPLPERVVVLVHGLDEVGGIFDDLAPALAAAGHTPVQMDYPNEQPIARSADDLLGHLATLAARGVRRVDLVGHSMGGLVIREAISRPEPYGNTARATLPAPATQAAPATGTTASAWPVIERIITVATPHGGSPLARYRGLAELREQISRFADQPSSDWATVAARLRAVREALRSPTGDGTQPNAGADLLPGSPFFTTLTARDVGRPPADVSTTVIIGRLAEPVEPALVTLVDRAVDLAGLSPADATAMRDWVRQTGAGLGDGVVSMQAAQWPGVTDIVVLSGNHRGILRTPDVEKALRRELAGLTGSGQASANPNPNSSSNPAPALPAPPHDADAPQVPVPPPVPTPASASVAPAIPVIIQRLQRSATPANPPADQPTNGAPATGGGGR